VEDEEAVADGLVTPPSGPMTNPGSALHGFVCPCEGFRGWKAISIRGKVASKSFGDLRTLGKGFDWDVKESKVVRKKVEGRSEAGKSKLEMLPIELLGMLVLFLIQFDGF
jgi:hypothetical protein